MRGGGGGGSHPPPRKGASERDEASVRTRGKSPSFSLSLWPPPFPPRFFNQLALLIRSGLAEVAAVRVRERPARNSPGFTDARDVCEARGEPARLLPWEGDVNSQKE